MSHVVLEPVLTIGNDGDREKAEKIVYKAELVRLMTNSLKTEETLEPVVHLENGIPELSLHNPLTFSIPQRLASTVGSFLSFFASFLKPFCLDSVTHKKKI